MTVICLEVGWIMTLGVSRPELTQREHETAALVLSGLSNKEIARILGTTEGTVKQHLHNIFTKLRIQSRAHLVLHARQLRQS